MRSRILLFVAAIAATWPTVARAQPSSAREKDDLTRARALDQQGAKAYSEGRYNDAIRYFEEARKLGGPPFELWNIAKCYMRLDEPDKAAEMLTKYLETPNLAADDRREAAQQLSALERRPSTLTVASSPSGASVSVDGKTIEGKTPLSVTVPPGAHTVVVTATDHPPVTKHVSARYGRAIILDASFTNDASGEKPPPPPKPLMPKDSAPAEPATPATSEELARVSVRAMAGVVLPRFGSVGGEAEFGGMGTATYRFSEIGRTSFAAGVMMFASGDSWRNTINAPNTATPCGNLRSPYHATALSYYGIGSVGWDIVPRLRAVVFAGAGVASYFATQVGGDLFVATCSASPGVRATFVGAAQIDWEVTRAFRISALPIALQLQPAFSGVRTTPVDTTGLWMRAMLGVGLGVDFW